MLRIHCGKTCFLQFQTKNSKMLDIPVSYLNNQISNNFNISLLGLKIDNYLTWKDHIDELVVKLHRSLRMVTSGMLRRVALVRTDVSEELSTYFIRVTRIGELGTTLAVTSN
jgi:hypothetical protein